jgi:hypothetical protein
MRNLAEATIAATPKRRLAARGRPWGHRSLDSGAVLSPLPVRTPLHRLEDWIQ